MLTGPPGSIDFDADVEMVGLCFPGVQQATEEVILRSRDRMKRARAVEGVGEDLCLRRRCTPPSIINLDPVRCVSRAHDPAGDNLEPAVRDQLGDGCANLGRDPMTVHVPPRAYVAQEPPMLVVIQALPDLVAMRPEAVDGSAPAELGASAAEPAKEWPETSRQLSGFDRDGLEIAMSARGKPPPG